MGFPSHSLWGCETCSSVPGWLPSPCQSCYAGARSSCSWPGSGAPQPSPTSLLWHTPVRCCRESAGGMGARERALGAARPLPGGQERKRQRGSCTAPACLVFARYKERLAVSSLDFSCWRTDHWDQNWQPGVSHLAGKEPVAQPQDLVVDELVASQLGQRLFEILNGLSMAVEQRMKVSPARGGNLPASKLVFRLDEFSRVSPLFLQCFRHPRGGQRF